MSALLHKIMIAMGRRGVMVPIDESLATAYRALQRYQEAYPSVFAPASEILLAEIEGGAIGIADIPQRLGHIIQMLDRLTREEELEIWTENSGVVSV